MENRSKIEAGKNSLQPRDECSRLLQVVTFITLPSSSYSRSIFTHVRREISKVKKPPLPLEMVPDLLILRYGWMIGNRLLSPCLLQNPATSFQPPYRFSLRHAFAWNSKRQYQILTRSWSSLDSSYTVRSIGRNIEQTLARKSRYRPHISANLFHDPRVFDFTSSFPFRRTATGESTIEGDRRGLIDR